MSFLISVRLCCADTVPESRTRLRTKTSFLISLCFRPVLKIRFRNQADCICCFRSSSASIGLKKASLIGRTARSLPLQLTFRVPTAGCLRLDQILITGLKGCCSETKRGPPAPCCSAKIRFFALSRKFLKHILPLSALIPIFFVTLRH